MPREDEGREQGDGSPRAERRNRGGGVTEPTLPHRPQVEPTPHVGLLASRILRPYVCCVSPPGCGIVIATPENGYNQCSMGKRFLDSMLLYLLLSNCHRHFLPKALGQKTVLFAI